MRTLLAIAFLSLSACGYSEHTTVTHQGGAQSPNDTGANVVDNPNFVATADEPLEPATYTLHFELSYDPTATTCEISMCPGDFDGSIKFDYVPTAQYRVSYTNYNQPVSAIYPLNPGQGDAAPFLHWSDPKQTYASGGCSATSYIEYVLPLLTDPSLGSLVTGVLAIHVDAPACNGAAGISCHCAYEVETTATTAHPAQ